MDLLCIECVALLVEKGVEPHVLAVPSNEPDMMRAVTVWNGNALCKHHALFGTRYLKTLTNENDEDLVPRDKVAEKIREWAEHFRDLARNNVYDATSFQRFVYTAKMFEAFARYLLEPAGSIIPGFDDELKNDLGD